MSLQAIVGDKIIGKAGPVTADSFKGKVVGLYFSAHWCPPCRAFTPVLIQTYNEAIKAGYEFDIIFVSSDSDQKSFDSYFGSMPWKAVQFDEEERRQSISEKFGVTGIPMFIVLKPDGSVLTTEGRREVTANKVNAIKAWVGK